MTRAGRYFVVNDELRVPAPATWRLWLTAEEVSINPHGALAIGAEDVDTDIFLDGPAAARLTTQKRTHHTYGLDSMGRYGKTTRPRIGLFADMGDKRLVPDLRAVLFPRLKTDKAPVFSSLLGGKVLKIGSGGATDYVFLGVRPFTFDAFGVSFQGTSGLARIRGAKATLSLGANGRLSALGEHVERADTTESVEQGGELIEGGDFESGAQSVLAAPPVEKGLVATLHEGIPRRGASTGGRYCVALTLGAATGITSLQEPVLVDASRAYRVRFKVYTHDAIDLQAGSYASDGTNPNLKDAQGQIWEYRVNAKGPTSDGWRTLETTVGPVGSAAFQWPPTTLKIDLVLRLSGAKGVLYMDDIAIEAIDAEK